MISPGTPSQKGSRDTDHNLVLPTCSRGTVCQVPHNVHDSNLKYGHVIILAQKRLLVAKMNANNMQRKTKYLLELECHWAS